MKSKTLLPLFVFLLLLAPVVTLAQFKPLVGIPGITDPNADFNTYINTLYAISISVAGLVAVIKIIVAGVKWMLSDLVTSKQDAKSDIQGALIGLLIILSAVLILEVINPQLTQTKLFLAPVDAVPGAGNASVPRPVPPTTPLPPPVLPIYEEITTCPNSTSTFSGFDCSAAKAACTAKNGREGSTLMASKFKCILGENTTVYCKEIPNPADPTGETIPDCNATRLICEAAGTSPVTKPGTYTKLNDNEWKANCYRPF